MGGGFGGIYCAKKLETLIAKRKIDAEITLVSRQNYFVFTPMLPQVISGMIESNHVVVPIRQALKQTKFYEAGVSSIDVRNKKVNVEVNGGEGPSFYLSLEYDHLVVSLGSDTNFLGISNIEDSVFTLKNLKDALVLRNHIIDMLERADIEVDPEKLKQMTNFIVVGGGLSGIETAAELNSFFSKAVKYYPNLKTRFQKNPISITVIQSRDRILPEINSELASFTLKKLRRDGISVVLDSKVVNVTNGSTKISCKDGRQSIIPANTVIWTAGISPNPITASIPCEKPASGRLPVDSFLRVKGYQNVWAVGDCAYIVHEITGEQFPATAQHALREAEIVAENIVSILKTESTTELKTFKYSRNAQMAVIGSKTAIANIAGVNLSGFLIWCLWRAVYLKKLPMFKKRLRVLFDWTMDLFFDPDLTHLRGLKEDRIIEGRTNKQVESQ